MGFNFLTLMKVFTNLDNIPFLSCVLSIGNFDGVHIGHQALLKQLKQQKQKHKAVSVVISFDPHPLEFFTKKTLRLFSLDDLKLTLTKLNIDYLFLLKFDQNMASLSPKNFLNQKINKLNPKAIVVGTDFCFGQKALGTTKTLKLWAKDKNLEIDIYPDVYLNSKKVSSSSLRLCYKNNQHKELEALLGRPFKKSI